MSHPAERLKRVIGRFGSGDGPLIITVGGIHGNEPAGVTASQRVLETLRARKPRFRGEYLALAGNIPALEAGRRYIDEDLNRIWLPDRFARLDAGFTPATIEELQLKELRVEVQQASSRAAPDVYFLDLHSTSAAGSAFSIFADTMHNRRLANALPCPMVLGLEEHLQGTFLNHINELGYAAVGFEGGQNASAAAVDAHEQGIWKTFVETGCLDATDIPEPIREALENGRNARLPRIVEIRYLHTIYPGEAFVMCPGFENLASVRKGETLARDQHGEIRSPETGFILMPLYQAQGTEGFFLVRRVRPFWLRVSAWLRALGAGNILPFLPGVRRRGEDSLVVDSRIARWLVVEVFHLLGFRRQRPERDLQVFTRRRENPRPLP
ncbi:MAG TPA: succinylglutamate desuccinylase/aspartoacylase family protein [Terriglobia bacterium]|nr:succinylglutamate desuccinylase/aspartoacylase family protein [Terriglobia bacterium]